MPTSRPGKKKRARPFKERCEIPPRVPDAALRRSARSELEHQERAIVEYMAGQAPDEEITHLEKVKSERLFDRKMDAWDVMTKGGRWWVITSPTNLYSQELFPTLDYTLSFHVGVTTKGDSTLNRALGSTGPRQIMDRMQVIA